MKKREFLSQLKNALENKMSAQEIKEQVDYYESYIEEEVRKGQTEEEVLEMLGDPWAIAKTIVISEEIGGNDYQAQSDSENIHYEEKPEGKLQVGGTNKILTMVILGAILLAILAIVFGLLAFVIRYAVPILVVLGIVYIWKKK